jgi:hypothetical protein
MNHTSNIQLGRAVRYDAGYGGIGGRGYITGIGQYGVDVILTDGRSIHGLSRIDQPGVGLKLLDDVAGPDALEALKQNAAAYEADLILQRAKARHDFERAEAARVIDNPPIFYWNGIKDAKGAKLQRCHYSESELTGYPTGTLTIYGRDYDRFSDKVAACFAVTNDTDTQVDYFASDTIRVIPTHPLHAQVKAAMAACTAHYAKRRGGK